MISPDDRALPIRRKAYRAVQPKEPVYVIRKGNMLDRIGSVIIKIFFVWLGYQIIITIIR